MKNGSILKQIPSEHGPTIWIVGIGGAGVKILDHMIDKGLKGVDFFAIDTDANVLRSKASRHLIIEETLTRGMGSGGDPELGRRAIEENLGQVKELLVGSDMVVIVAGMGGGTATSATPVVGQIAWDLGALTLGFVTMPLGREGVRRSNLAELGITRLKKHVDTLFPIQNGIFSNLLLWGQHFMDTLWQEATKKLYTYPCIMNLPLPSEIRSKAFLAANDFLLFAVRGIIDLIMVPSLIQFDSSDARAVLGSPEGQSRQGIVRLGLGENGSQAAMHAIRSKHLGDALISGATSCLVNVSAGRDLDLTEIMDAIGTITRASENAEIAWGTSFNPTLKDNLFLSRATQVIVYAVK